MIQLEYNNWVNRGDDIPAINKDGGDIDITTNGIYKTVNYYYNTSTNEMEFIQGEDDGGTYFTLGVLTDDVDADKIVNIKTKGIFVLQASGSISMGQYVNSADVGKVKVSAGTPPAETRAIALCSATDGNPVMVQIY